MRQKYFKEPEEEKMVEEVVEAVPEPENKTQKVKVITKLLNIRKGPGMNYESTGKLLALGEEVEITEVVNDFGHLKKSGDWISMKYVKITE